MKMLTTIATMAKTMMIMVEMTMIDRTGGTATKEAKGSAGAGTADRWSGRRRKRNIAVPTAVAVLRAVAVFMSGILKMVIVPVMEAAVNAEWSVRMSVCLWHLLAKAAVEIDLIDFYARIGTFLDGFSYFHMDIYFSCL